MDPIVCPACRNERFAELVQVRFARVQLLFGYENAYRFPVLGLSESADAERIMVQPPFRFLGHLHFRDQRAGCRSSSGKFDAGRFADKASSAVASGEIFGAQRLALGQMYVDTAGVLRKARHLTSAIDPDAKLVDPAGQNALDVRLPQSQSVVVPCRKVTDVEPDPREARDLCCLSLGEKPIGDSTLIEDLDRA